MKYDEVRATQLRNAILQLHSRKLVHGSPNAKFWFVGLEGGNHHTGIDLENFLIQQAQLHAESNDHNYRSLRGYKCTRESCDEHCPTTRKPNTKNYLPCKHTGSPSQVKWQATYAGYIKLLLSVTQQHWDVNDVKEYQWLHLGEIDTNIEHTSALTELYPLDCQRRDDWPYKNLATITGLSYLQSARRYREWAIEQEWQKLIDAIIRYQPSFAVFYGNEQRTLAREHPQLDFKSVRIRSTKNTLIDTGFSTLGHTQLVFARHPAGHTSDQYWRNIAKELRTYIPETQRAA